LKKQVVNGIDKILAKQKALTDEIEMVKQDRNANLLD